MNNLVLTVSMPNYNHGHYLVNRIHSLLAAMPLDSELLIVDDGSTDNSVEIIEDFSRKDSRIILIKNGENRGVNYSLNVMLKNARGKYIAFQSADDFILPEFFVKTLKIAQQYSNVGICCSDCGICYENHSEQIIKTRLLEAKSEPCVFSPEEAVQLFRSTCFWIRGHTALIKRESIIRLGGFHPQLQPHDDWFLLHGIALQEGIAYIPETLAVWRQAPNGYCSTILKDQKRRKECHRQLLKMLSRKECHELRSLFKKSTLLRESVKVLLGEIMFQPKYWDILGVLLLKFVNKRINRLFRK